ncbi:hypothetical protein GCM10022197_39470 [Microlunatus spumicola]|uniref:DUF1579 domain-containing protein n=1 Tax=Microlunatus spumicola TaxID=81499 RepID=A0ABP6Y9I9_9ACTN
MSEHDSTDGTSRLESLEPLVGDWDLGEDTTGTVTYAWLPGKHFLVQHFDLVLHDHRVTGLEVIGHLRPYGQGPTPEIWSRAYDDAGNTLDYVYELEGRTLTIWAGGPGSPAFYRGTFAPDGRSGTGAWTYPGGGYRSSMTRRDG